MELTNNTLFKAEVLKTGIVKLETKGSAVRSVTFPSFQKLVAKGVVNEMPEEDDTDNAVVMIPPSNCIYQGNRVDKNGVKKLDIMCFYPEKMVSIQHGSTTHRMPLPHVLLKYTLNKAEKENGVWVLDTRTIKWMTASSGSPLTYIEKGFSNCNPNTSHLCALTLPNMYNDGRMCTGGNQIPTRYMDNNFMPLNWLYDLIEGSPFNNDLSLHGMSLSKAKRIYGPSKFKGVKGIRSDEFSISGWLGFLSCFETFPYDVLSMVDATGEGCMGKLRDEFTKKA